MKYPPLAKELGLQGRVYMRFTLEQDGSLSDFQILRGLGGDCEAEVMRLMKECPQWLPAKQAAKPNYTHQLPAPRGGFKK